MVMDVLYGTEASETIKGFLGIEEGEDFKSEFPSWASDEKVAEAMDAQDDIDLDTLLAQRGYKRL